MSKPYQKECIFCRAKITMSDEKGKWRPFNADGTEHDCKSKESIAESANQKQETKDLERLLEILIKNVQNFSRDIERFRVEVGK